MAILWENYEYEISYIDPEEMSQLRTYTDREHLLEALDKIFNRHGYQVKIVKRSWQNSFNVIIYNYQRCGGVSRACGGNREYTNFK